MKVLAALPGEMVEEVREQYKRKKEDRERKVVEREIVPVTGLKIENEGKTAFDALMRPKLDSSLKSSPVKLNKGKRGRPKGSVNKNKKVDSKKAGHDNVSKDATEMPCQEESIENNNDQHSNQETEFDMDVFDALPEDLKKEVQDQMKGRPLASASKRVLFEESNSRASESSLVGETHSVESVGIETTSDSTQEMIVGKGDTRIPTFCGETEVSKLRPLLKSWLTAAPMPKEDDVQLLGNFLKDLVIAWKLDKAHVLLKCLHR